MHSICVWDMIKQSKPLQTRYDTTYIFDKKKYTPQSVASLTCVNHAALIATVRMSTLSPRFRFPPTPQKAKTSFGGP